jgi:hypothetical protein
MRIMIDLRPEAVVALDALRRQSGGTRENVCTDLIEAALGIGAPDNSRDALWTTPTTIGPNVPDGR